MASARNIFRHAWWVSLYHMLCSSFHMLRTSQVGLIRFIVSHPLLLLVTFITYIFIFNIAELVFRASNDLELFNRLSYKLLQSVQSHQPFDGNPLYGILHEPMYCQGYVTIWCLVWYQALRSTPHSADEHPPGLLLAAWWLILSSPGNMSRCYLITNRHTSREKWYPWMYLVLIQSNLTVPPFSDIPSHVWWL